MASRDDNADCWHPWGGLVIPARVQITREELYRAIWEKPAVHLAKEYGISDVALGKHCQRLHIPKPGIGYWTKKKHGKPARRPRLPPFQGADSVEIIRQSPLPTLPGDVTADLKTLRVEVARMPPSTDIRKLLPVVKSLTSKTETGIHLPADKFGRVCFQGLLTTRTHLDRACLILDTLLRILGRFECLALPLEGHSSYELGLVLRIRQADVAIRIIEEVVPAKRENMPGWGTPYRSDPPRGCTGRLVFQIGNYYGNDHIQWRWRDGNKARLEDMVSPIAEAVFVRLRRKQIEAEDREAQRLRRIREDEQRVLAEREKEELRQREECRRQEQEARRKALENTAERWTKCQQMRAYLVAFEAKIEAEGLLSTDDEAARWLAWAKAYVESQDPLAGIQTRAVVPTPSVSAEVLASTSPS